MLALNVGGRLGDDESVRRAGLLGGGGGIDRLAIELRLDVHAACLRGGELVIVRGAEQKVVEVLAVGALATDNHALLP